MNKNTVHTINQYLTGKLGIEEKKAFEMRMKNDDELQEEVEFNRKFIFTLNNIEVIRLNSVVKQNLKCIPESAYVNSEPISDLLKVKAPLFSSFVRWSLLTVFVISVCSVMFLMNRSTPLQKLGETYLKPLPAYTDVTGTDHYSLGFINYKKGNYRKSVYHLNKYLENTPKDDNVKLYLGIAQLHADHLEDALMTFNTIRNSDVTLVRKHIQWYSALAYIQNNKPNEAKQLLEQESNKERYGKQARELIQKIIISK